MLYGPITDVKETEKSTCNIDFVGREHYLELSVDVVVEPGDCVNGMKTASLDSRAKWALTIEWVSCWRSVRCPDASGSVNSFED